MEFQEKMVSVSVNEKTHTVRVGTKVSELLEDDRPCGGHGKCGKCKVITKGVLSPVSDNEKALLSDEEISSGIRLACVAQIEGECQIRSLSYQAAGGAQILTAGDLPELPVDPMFSAHGVAVDIGTTTLAASLYDARGLLLSQDTALNPQSKWGADVISRMEAALNGEEDAISKSIQEEIDDLLIRLTRKAEIFCAAVDAIVLTGNTAMLHLLTKTSVEPLTHAPFQAKRLFGEFLTAQDLGLTSVQPKTAVYLPPCISAFVGADTVCALLATGLCRSNEDRLLVDIGTNGEMALWNNGRLTVASTAAGPAFEGGGISMGMRGIAGAIDRVRMEADKLSIHVIGDKEPRGICGSGLIDAVACMLESGRLDEGGYLEEDPQVLLGPVSLTQRDIRMVQLAKSAICAGIRTLLHSAGMESKKLSSVLLAGGFGNYLDIHNAGRIGLIPQKLTDRVHVAGNAALDGAAMMLLHKAAIAEAAEIATGAEVLAFSSNPVFSEFYMMGMTFDDTDR